MSLVRRVAPRAARGARPLVTATAAAAVATPVRFLEYWGIGVTGRTQAFAQGDVLPRLDNTRNPVRAATAEAAALTGNANNVVYDSSNIFSAADYSVVEKEHNQPLRGIDRHKIEPLSAADGPLAAAVLRALQEPEVELSLEYLWWRQLLRDYPSLKKPATPAFKKEWTHFYEAALEVAHKDAAVVALARPFLRTQMQEHYISYALVWRIAEALIAALTSAPGAVPNEIRAARLSVERVTKLMLDTIADEPWAMHEATSPLHVEVSNFRAWHEAGNW